MYQYSLPFFIGLFKAAYRQVGEDGRHCSGPRATAHCSNPEALTVTPKQFNASDRGGFNMQKATMRMPMQRGRGGRWHEVKRIAILNDFFMERCLRQCSGVISTEQASSQIDRE